LDRSVPHFGANAGGILIDEQGAVVLTETSVSSLAWADAHSPLVDPSAPSHAPEGLLRRYHAALALVDGLVYQDNPDKN